MFKHLKSYYLEVQHLVHFVYHCLPVAIYVDFPTVFSDGHGSGLHFICPIALTFLFENGVSKCREKATNITARNIRKFQKFTVSSISRFSDINGEI